MTEELEDAASNLEVLPRGSLQALAAARDLCEPASGLTLDTGFDLLKNLQGSKRRLITAKEMERASSIVENPPKRSNIRRSTGRRSSRNLQGEFQSPDLSFLQSLSSRSDGQSSTPTSSGSCKSQNRINLN